MYNIWVLSKNELHILKLNSEHLTFLCIYQLWQISYIFFWYILEVHTQNQWNLKQWVKGSCIVRYWSTAYGIWCLIYYDLDFNKGCWRETCNHNFLPNCFLLVWAEFQQFFGGSFSLCYIWNILQWLLSILSEFNQKHKVMCFAVSSIKLLL